MHSSLTSRSSVNMKNVHQVFRPPSASHTHICLQYMQYCTMLTLFTQRVINAWHSLPGKVVESKTLAKFKSQFDFVQLNQILLVRAHTYVAVHWTGVWWSPNTYCTVESYRNMYYTVLTQQKVLNKNTPGTFIKQLDSVLSN